MTVHRHGKKWMFDFWKEGRRHREGGYPTKEAAKMAETDARKNLKQINSGFMRLCERKLAELEAKRSKSHTRENLSLFKKLIDRWGKKKKVTRDDVEEYLQECAEDSTQKANKHLRLIKALFNYGLKREWISINPAANIDKYPISARRRYVPPLEDVMAVFKEADEEQKLYLTVIANTMARIREINQLKWSDIYDDHLILKTRKARNSDLVERKIPLNKTLKAVLKKIPKTGEYVFMNPTTGKPYDYRKKMMRGLCKRAGVKYFTFHALRHLGATRLDNKKVPLTIIQGLLGHQRATTTDLYLRSLTEGMRGAVDELEIEVPTESPHKGKRKEELSA